MSQVGEQASPQLLDIATFARMVSMSTIWARRQIRQRQISAVRMGSRAIRIPAGEVQRLIANGLVPRRG